MRPEMSGAERACKMMREEAAEWAGRRGKNPLKKRGCMGCEGMGQWGKSGNETGVLYPPSPREDSSYSAPREDADRSEY